MTKKKLTSPLSIVFRKNIPANHRIRTIKKEDGPTPINFYKDGDRYVYIQYEDDRVYCLRKYFDELFNIPYVNSYNVYEDANTGKVTFTPVLDKTLLEQALDKGEIDVRTYNNLINELYKK